PSMIRSFRRRHRSSCSMAALANIAWLISAVCGPSLVESDRGLQTISVCDVQLPDVGQGCCYKQIVLDEDSSNDNCNGADALGALKTNSPAVLYSSQVLLPAEADFASITLLIVNCRAPPV